MKSSINHMILQPVILAAGQGLRMKSALPKVLHRLGGKPLLQHVIDVAVTVAPNATPIVIYGHQGDKLKQAFANRAITWVEQREQKGTGHALQQSLPHLGNATHVLVLYGDVPLVSVKTLLSFIEQMKEQHLGLLTAHFTNPHGYGRIQRENGKIVGIVEEKDATDAEKNITEINTGIYLLPTDKLNQWLPKLTNRNTQGEFYLTDVIRMAVNDKLTICTTQPDHFEEVLGVNDRAQLATLERFHQHQLATALMQQGVSLADPNRIDIRGTLNVAQDVTIDINCVFEGDITLKEGVSIEPNCLLRNVTIDTGTVIKANSVLEDTTVGKNAVIGPFARLRPGTDLADETHIGNFVEIKNSVIGKASKVNHLSYLGDATVGQRVNVGAGTITCNYDGANKHRTVIEDDVHIGSDTQLIAPVTVGKGGTIAAGSTLTDNTPEGGLTLTQQLDQRHKASWQRPKKEFKENVK